MPIFATVIGALVTVIGTVILMNVREINAHLTRMNGRLSTHIEKADLHEAGFAHTSEQIKSLLQTVTVAHTRLDRLEAREAA